MATPATGSSFCEAYHNRQRQSHRDSGSKAGVILEGVLQMHGERSIEEMYAFFRRPECAKSGGPEMLLFLDAAAEVLRSKLVYFGTSHLTMTISKSATYSNEEPFVAVHADGECYDLMYLESWQDGPLFRTREDRVRCKLAHVSAALSELISRLKSPVAS